MGLLPPLQIQHHQQHCLGAARRIPRGCRSFVVDRKAWLRAFEHMSGHTRSWPFILVEICVAVNCEVISVLVQRGKRQIAAMSRRCALRLWYFWNDLYPPETLSSLIRS